MSENIDPSSFASILAGVQQMRQAYDEPVNTEKDTESGNAAEEPAQSPTVNSNVSPPPRLPPQNDLSKHTAEVIRRRPEQRQRQRRPAQNVQRYSQVQVANSQKGNPLLDSASMKMTPWTYNGLILLDYYINATLQILFLSLKYHRLRPEYIWNRIEKLKGLSIVDEQENNELLRVLLVVVDIDSPQDVIRSLAAICVRQGLSMVVAWSFEEAGNYISYFKSNEMARSKIDLSIQGVKRDDYNSNIVQSLTTVRAINKTDVANLLANCKSFRNIVEKSVSDDLTNIQGLGERKLLNLKAAFSEPFIYNRQANDERLISNN